MRTGYKRTLAILAIMPPVLLCSGAAGYMYGKASSPDYNSTGGRQVFVRFVAASSETSGRKLFVDRDRSNRLLRLYKRPTQLKYRCGFREYTFTDDGTLSIRGIEANAAGIHDRMRSKGIDALEIAAFVAGGREALLLPKTLSRTRSAVEAPGTKAETIARGAAVVAGVLSGFEIGYLIGYDDTISCVDAGLAAELKDKTFWEAALSTYPSPPSSLPSSWRFASSCEAGDKWSFEYGPAVEMIARNRDGVFFSAQARIEASEAASLRLDENGYVWSKSFSSGTIWILDDFSAADFVLTVDSRCQRAVAAAVEGLDEVGEHRLADTIKRKIQFKSGP